MLRDAPRDVGVQATEGAWTITRKATEQVTTIGIDIGKNTYQPVGLNGGLGSRSGRKSNHLITSAVEG